MGLIAAMTLGCSDDDKAPGAGAEAGVPDAGASTDGIKATLGIKGQLVPATGEKVPAKSRVTTLWMVGAVGSDYLYKLGGAAVNGSSFQFSLSTSLPPAALSVGGAGIGNIALVTDGTNLADGKVTSANIGKGSLMGWDRGHALIYRPASLPGGSVYQWLEPFPVGLSCGKFVDEKTGFTPSDCGSFTVTVAAAPKTPPWW